MKSKLILICGLPGAGKSTYVEKYESEGYVVHASDRIRAEMGDETDQSHNTEVFDILYKRVKEDLLAGKNVVIDCTNLRRKYRMHFLRTLQGVPCHKKCVVVCVPFEECLTNNTSRERQVPEHVMFAMLGKFQVPTYVEGWDEIEFYYPQPEYEGYYGDPFEDINTLKEYDQGNSNHKLSLGEHMERAGIHYLANHGVFDDAAYATYLHDIGKPIMRGDKNGKGEVDGEAHYLNHQNCGSYLSLFYNTEDWPWIDKQYVALLIELHMRPYLEYKNSEQKLEKDTNLFGQKTIDDVFQIHICDRIAR